MNFDWNPAIQALITVVINNLILLLIPIIMAYIVTLLRKWVDMIKQKEIHDFVISAVRAAQGIIPDKSARYDYVSGLLASKYKFLKKEDVQRLIEASIVSLKSNPF